MPNATPRAARPTRGSLRCPARGIVRAAGLASANGEVEQAIDAAGEDVYARLDALVHTLGRRNQFIRQAMAPLEDQLALADHQRLLAALAVGFGAEVAISLTDVAGLAPEDALEMMAATCRWILSGTLAEAEVQRT